MTAAQEIAGFLAKFSPAIQKEARAARRAIRAILPTATELVYDNYNALVFAFAPGERASEAILSIALYPSWVTLFFLHGKGLADPDKLLRGAGTMVRQRTLSTAARPISHARRFSRSSAWRSSAPRCQCRRRAGEARSCVLS